MILTASQTELTTSITDLLLTLECLAALVYLRRVRAGTPWRVELWSWVFAFIAFAALLGATMHGIEVRPFLRAILWNTLLSSLGFVVALFVAGAFGDWHSRALAMRLIPWCIGVGLIFFGLTIFSSGVFIVFMVYEAAAMIVVLAIYSFLAATRRLRGAATMTVAVILNFAAAGVQASSRSLHVFVAFDHNGLSHLIQILAIAVLALGLRTIFSESESMQRF